MSQADTQYYWLCREILDRGNVREDRTGVGTKGIFGHQCRFELGVNGFPLLTSKRVAFDIIKAELLWFLEGSTDERRLAEIQYGKPRSELTDKKTIWWENANADYWKGAKFPGDLGPVYGKQWRYLYPLKLGTSEPGAKLVHLDQITQVIESLKTDPMSRRHLVVSWNPGEIEQMALPPCHCLFQFYVRQVEGVPHLDCHLYQRSADVALGVPFNIASYALLTHMIAQCVDMAPGEFIHTFGDAHIYLNHIDGIKKQLRRESLAAPTLRLNPEIKNINDFKMEDIILEDYFPQAAIKFPFAV